MKVIKSDLQKIFKQLQSSQVSLVIWQLSPATGERLVSQTYLLSIHPDKTLLQFQAPTDFTLSLKAPVYCYCKDGLFIFKTALNEVQPEVVNLHFPEEIKFLEAPDVEIVSGKTGVDLSDILKVKSLHIDPPEETVKSMAERSTRDQEFLNNEFHNVSLDEEDKLFADKRATPRARPKTEKFVKVMGSTTDEVHFLKLFDLSQGGIGFISMEPHLFEKGTRIRVVGFEDFDLDDPLFGTIMSQRPIDDTQIEYKIGCKFDEGQS